MYATEIANSNGNNASNDNNIPNYHQFYGNVKHLFGNKVINYTFDSVIIGNAKYHIPNFNVAKLSLAIISDGLE